MVSQTLATTVSRHWKVISSFKWCFLCKVLSALSIASCSSSTDAPVESCGHFCVDRVKVDGNVERFALKAAIDICLCLCASTCVELSSSLFLTGPVAHIYAELQLFNVTILI